MRAPRDFRPQQLYGVTQRGNRGQWVYRDAQDFSEALRLMAKYARRHEVRVHGWSLLHNHGHWIFEASTEESISNLMRDMQSCYSRFLNKKYRHAPWLLLAPRLGRRRSRRNFSAYLRAGPVNWTPRFDAVFLDGAGFRSFLRYVENNAVRAKLVKKAERWEWSSAQAHLAGEDLGGLLCLDRWRHLFGSEATAATDWREFLEGPGEEERLNSLRMQPRRSSYNRPLRSIMPEATVELVLGAPPG